MLHAVCQQTPKITVCTRQDLWERSTASCSTLLLCCLKNGDLLSSQEWTSLDSIAGIACYLSECWRLLSALLMTVLSFSKMVRLLHLRFNTVLQCKTLNFLFPEVWPCNSENVHWDADLLVHPVYTQFCSSTYCLIAFSSLTLLVGCQEDQLACKNWVMRCWHGYLSGAKCKWFAYVPADASAIPSSLASLKCRMVYLFGTGFPRLSWKRDRKCV